MSGLLLFSLAGLSGAALAGALGVALALTVGLYLLKLRRRKVQVPFLDLWESLLLDRKASAWRTRLQRFLSLLLSLLLVGALIFAFADPRPESEKKRRSLVILLDVSASMASLAEPLEAQKSKTAEARTRLAAAKAEIKSWLPSFRGGDEVLLVEMGARPRPLAAFTGDETRLSDALESAEVLDVVADLDAALSLASDALKGRQRGEIIVVSDGALAPQAPFEGPPISFYRVAPLPSEGVAGNVGVTAFSARRYPLAGDRFEVLAEVTNFSDRAAEVELSLYEAQKNGERGAVVEVLRLKLAPDERVAQTFENLSHAEQGLIAQIRRVDGVVDSFVADDVARTLLSPRTPVRVLVVGPENNFLEAALLVEESLIVTRVSAASYPPAGEFDVTIFDGEYAPRSASTGAAIYFGAPPEDDEAYPVAVVERLEMFGFDTWKKSSEVFRLIDPYDVQVLEGMSLKPQEADFVLGSSAGRPIFVAGEREQGRFLALGFSPRKSDFVLRAVWPLFVVNLIDYSFPRGRGEALLGLKTGNIWRPPVVGASGLETAVIRGPLSAGETIAEHPVPVQDGRAVFFGQQAGFYEVKTSAGSTRFSASLFEGGEAVLEPAEELLVSGKAAGAVTGMEPRPYADPWFWLLAFVFVVSFCEWWFYHRRWTV